MYDHRSHAGNQGDVVKHVALLAALRHALEESSRTVKYVDAFAGPGGSLLLPGGEWTRGVGKLDRTAVARSPDLQAWIRWYLARPHLAGSLYPGSALIAHDMDIECGKKVAMTLWDTSADAVADLREIFPKHRIEHGAIDPAAKAVREADFLFIDPPGVASEAKPSFPPWSLLLRLMSSGRRMLTWLPINAAVVGGSARISAPAEAQINDVLALHHTPATRVLWAHGGRTIGCHLVYRSGPQAAAAIRAGVEEVVSRCSWTRKEIQHFDARESVA